MLYSSSFLSDFNTRSTSAAMSSSSGRYLSFRRLRGGKVKRLLRLRLVVVAVVVVSLSVLLLVVVMWAVGEKEGGNMERRGTNNPSTSSTCAELLKEEEAEVEASKAEAETDDEEEDTDTAASDALRTPKLELAFKFKPECRGAALNEIDSRDGGGGKLGMRRAGSGSKRGRPMLIEAERDDK